MSSFLNTPEMQNSSESGRHLTKLWPGVHSMEIELIFTKFLFQRMKEFQKKLTFISRKHQIHFNGSL